MKTPPVKGQFWGWIDRSGTYIPVDCTKTGHQGLAERINIPTTDMESMGFLKVTQSVGCSISWWYECKIAMSVEQERWLDREAPEARGIK